ncbi:MAG: heparinase II/III family protein [Bacteroides sp.]|nr:heparinase II/III family protein [Bacteroides sp.]
MKKHFLSFVCLIIVATLQLQGEERNFLQKKADIAKIKEVLVMNQEWVPYPDYTDRAGWDELLGEFKESIIKNGEKYLDYEYKVIKATDYLEYERSGSREIMSKPSSANNTAVSALIGAELAEGKGRFIEPIINGVFYLCEKTSWASSAHTAAYQKTRRAIPDHREHIMDLGHGGTAQMLSWTYYFLHKEFDKVDPIISIRLRHELQIRELDPYMQRRDLWWMGYNVKPGGIINNWNPWCNSNALICFFLLENNKDVLAEAVYKTMTSVDLFLNHVKADGGCDEGPSYWGHAAGKLYDYLKMLYLGTNGQISIFDEPQIQKMGEYIVRSYIGNGWVVNFADASARGGGDAGLIYRYGTAVNSNLMKEFAAILNKEKPVKPGGWGDMFRQLETLRCIPELRKETPAYSTPEYTWYPETEFCYFSNKNGMFMATKGGYNNESHNHNDVATLSLYFNTTPVLIDAGVGTYTRQTFSSERYSIWTMQSNYHNIPMINGVPQKFGSQYKATDVKVNLKAKTFSANIATAYPEEAKVENWTRSYRLGSNNLKIEDTFSLKETVAPNQVNFLTWGKVDISEAGVVTIEVKGEKAALKYDKNQFDVSIETIKLEDPKLSNVWGPEIYRLSLTSKQQTLKGKYTFTVSKI